LSRIGREKFTSRSFSNESSLRPPFSSSTHTPSLLRLITTKKGRLTFDKERRDIRTSTFKGDYKGRIGVKEVRKS
jgi:hypothetical protein